MLEKAWKLYESLHDASLKFRSVLRNTILSDGNLFMKKKKLT